MIVLKKINNNVAECIDNNGRELVAFGNGIGFPKVPYEIEDLSKIRLTFYRLDEHYLKLITEIPENILDLSLDIVMYAQEKLSGTLNTNLVFSLADHLNFAIKRTQASKEIKFFLSADLKELYKKETQIAAYAVELIKKKIFVVLPDSEISSITMHLINAQEEFKSQQEEDMTEIIIEKITTTIERYFEIIINREEFNYNRFQMHLRYYLKRIRETDSFMSDNQELFELVKKEKPEIFNCVLEINQLIVNYLGKDNKNEEILYLMIHINRILEKNTERR